MAGIEPNVVVVSDHGMTPTSIERVAIIDPHLDLAATLVESDGSLVALRPLSGSTEDLLARAKQIPHGQAYLRDALPAHFHATANPRFAPVSVVAERRLATRAQVDFRRAVACVSRARLSARRPRLRSDVAQHAGHLPRPPVRPSKRGVTLPAVENIHVLRFAVRSAAPATGSPRRRRSPHRGRGSR
jgi:hypothetical protein